MAAKKASKGAKSAKGAKKAAASAKPPAKKAAAKTAKKAAAKPVGTLRVTKKPAATPAPAKPAVEKKKPARRPSGSAPIQKTRVVIAMDFYEPNKDAVKAPFKEHALKWNFLGEGKGLYKRVDGGVHCFTQFKDDGVHYSIWGEDKRAVEAILASWRGTLGEERFAKATASGEQAVAAEQAQVESEALRLWKLAEPQPRPGEPDFFLQKRIAEWKAKKPA